MRTQAYVQKHIHTHTCTCTPTYTHTCAHKHAPALNSSRPFRCFQLNFRNSFGRFLNVEILAKLWISKKAKFFLRWGKINSLTWDFKLREFRIWRSRIIIILLCVNQRFHGTHLINVKWLKSLIYSKRVAEMQAADCTVKSPGVFSTPLLNVVN